MMQWFIFLFFALCSPLHAQLIEFYADWSWNSKGTKLFTPTSDQEDDWTTLWKIQAQLQMKGWEIRCWDYDFYHPLLLKGNDESWNAWQQQKKNPSEWFWVFWNMGGRLKDIDLSKVPKEKLVLFMWEPPTVQKSLYTKAVQDLFHKIFTWDDDLVDNQKFFKFNYPSLKKRIEHVPDFDQKKLCVMINTRLKDTHPLSLYGERTSAALFFEDKEEGEFDLYGRFWENYKNWKGKAKSKAQTLPNYKFCICYENMKNAKGYITEKIFDCFMAGCLPVYWGASNITDYIPKDCFIDRRKFASMEALYAFMQHMRREEYEGYLNRAAKFLESEKAQVFSKDAFVKIFMEQLIP
jgi:hypothetical protein